MQFCRAPRIPIRSGGSLVHSRDWSALSAAYIFKPVPNVHVFVYSTNTVLRKAQNPSLIFTRVVNFPSRTSSKLFNKKLRNLRELYSWGYILVPWILCLLLSVEVLEGVQTGIPESQERNCISTFRTTQKYLPLGAFVSDWTNHTMTSSKVRPC